MTKKQCPLGEEILDVTNLTVSYLARAQDARDKAKARIEDLEAKLKGSVAECERVGRLWHDAEAKLAKAVNVLEKIRDEYNEDWQAGRWVRTALAELKGEKQ